MMDGDFDLALDEGAEGAEAIVACLGDDAAHLRLENPESEIAANMDAAAVLIEQLQALLAEALQCMTALHGSMRPDESTPDIDATVPGAAVRTFVDTHARLIYELHNCAGPQKVGA